MSQDIESFNSFLAGVLLTKKRIGNLEFANLMCEFENSYNVCIASSDDVEIPVYLDDKSISIHNDYEDIVIIGNKSMTVYDYLYSLTSLRVRNYFNLKNEKMVNVKEVKSIKKTLKRIATSIF